MTKQTHVQEFISLMEQAHAKADKIVNSTEESSYMHANARQWRSDLETVLADIREATDENYSPLSTYRND